MEGRIKLHRKVLSRGRYTDLPARSLFFHILLLCQHQEYEYKGIKLLPGQCTLGRRKTAKLLGLTEMQYRWAIEHLKTTHEITLSTTHSYTLITVCKWEEYQGDDKKQPAKQPRKQPANNPPTTTKQEVILNSITEEKNNIKQEDKFFENEKVNETFKQFLEMRKEKKREATLNAIGLLIKKLSRYNDEVKIKMLENSIISQWTDVYEPKEQKSQSIPPGLKEGYKHKYGNQGTFTQTLLPGKTL